MTSVVETRSAPRPTFTQGGFDLFSFQYMFAEVGVGIMVCWKPLEGVPQTCKDMTTLDGQDMICMIGASDTVAELVQWDCAIHATM